MDFLAGQTLLFDKPKGWTSFDVVKKVRNTIRVKKVGHAGTLDPLATGLLILCTGKHTKQINQIQEQEKEYRVSFKLGATTRSYDAEYPEENFRDASHIDEPALRLALKAFTGPIKQVPPAFSAIKVGGRRAYRAARAGEEIELKAREVNIYSFELVRFESANDIEAIVCCSKGTYIRSLIHDLGQYLGTGGYMTGLVRTRIGDYKLEEAWQIADFVHRFANQESPEK